MGRPLKIQKISTGSGNSGASVAVDLAYPNFGSLTNPVFNSPVQTLNDNQYLGVVGGAAPTDTPTTTNPRIDVTVNIAQPDGSGLGVAQGYIIRQKGAYTQTDSTATPLSKLTNKFLLDWTGGSTYEANQVINDVRIVANFFTDEGTVIKSGTAQTTITLAIVDNVTS